MRNGVRSICGIVALSLSLGGACRADELLGAAEVLRQVGEKAEAATPEADAPGATLRADLEAFTEESAGLAPDEAATRWLALVDAWMAAGEGEGVDPYMSYGFAPQGAEGGKPTVNELIEAIPGPEAWPALVAAVEARPAGEGDAARRERGLRMLVHFLAGQHEAVAEDLAGALGNLESLDEWQAMQLREHLQRVAKLIADGDASPEATRQMLERQLEIATRSPDEVYSFEVPDLVPIFGEAEARRWLERILVLQVASLEMYETGEATQALTRAVATEVVERMPVARWELVDTADAVELYEALAGKFVEPEAAAEDAVGGEGAGAPPSPAAGGSGGGIFARLRELVATAEVEAMAVRMGHADDGREAARGYYIMGLIVRDRTEDAAAELIDGGDELDLPYEFAEALSERGVAAAAEAVLRDVLKEHPGLPVWEDYHGLAFAHGHGEEMIELTRAAAAREDLGIEKQRAIKLRLAEALLAVDLVDDAAGVLRELVADKVADDTASSAASRLARLGLLLERPEWVDEGLAAMPAPSDDDHVGYSFGVRRSEDLLIEAGRHAEVERRLLEALRRAVHPADQGPYARAHGRGAWQGILVKLAGLYHELDRHADVVTLLDEAPYWGVKDLAELLDQEATARKKLAPVAAAALAAVGRQEEAVELVTAHLLGRGAGHDPSYEVLVSLRGQAALPQLEALYARDRFEERPLIWKASLQLSAGDADAAHATIQQAIAIDPSDGEQGKGDRLRAYAVLADVLEAKGDAEEAKRYRGAVEAVRLSEHADDFFTAGLITRSIAMYEEALGRFVDAYCVQWRLAVRLTGLGRHDEAAAHFRRAYELMPVSFGRVESYCFGCEGVFSEGKSRDIAADVLAELAREKPDSAQVHYLLGYFHASGDDPEKALPHLRRAVEIDPDYLSAWEQIESVASAPEGDAEVREEATLNLLRLDPLRRHSHPSLDRVMDMAALWRTAAAHAGDYEAPPEAVYPLEASAERLRKLEEAAIGGAGNFGNPYGHHYAFNPYWGGSGLTAAQTPGELIASHQVVQAVGQLMQ